MSNYGSNKVEFVLVDGFNLTGDLSELNDEGVEPIVERRTAFADDFERQVYVGMDKALGANHNGWFDDRVLGTLAALKTYVGTSRIFSYNLEGNLLGKKFVAWAGVLETKFTRICTLAALHRIAVTYMGNGAQEEPRILKPLAQVSASGDTEATSYDENNSATALTTDIVSSSVANPSVITTVGDHGLATGDTVVIAGHTGSTPTVNGERIVTVTGAKTFTIPVNVTVGGTGGTVRRVSTPALSGGVGGGAGYCHVTEFTGITGLAVKVRHSPDNAVFSDLITFTSFTATGAQRVATAVRIERFTAAKWTFTGAGTATLVVGFARG